MLQGVALGRRRKSNSLLISESTASNDETYKDEQYMQRIAEQVKKLVTTKEVLKDDSPQDNILSEKAVKKIHEAGNCELQEIQQRTNKVQCQRCYSYKEAGIQVSPSGGQLNMSEEMLSSIRQKMKQLEIPRDARSQEWCSAAAEAPFLSQRVFEKKILEHRVEVMKEVSERVQRSRNMPLKCSDSANKIAI